MRRVPFTAPAVRRGFTLVEVLIVVVILGILAATVLPQFTGATEDAKEAALKQNLQQIRTQIDLYKFQHNGAGPGTTDDAFYTAMLCKTDATGGTTGGTTDGPVMTALGTGAYGPYIMGKMPTNPFNSKNDVTVSAANVTTGATGWSYNTTTGEFRLNVASTVLLTDDTPANQL